MHVCGVQDLAGWCSFGVGEQGLAQMLDCGGQALVAMPDSTWKPGSGGCCWAETLEKMEAEA